MDDNRYPSLDLLVKQLRTSIELWQRSCSKVSVVYFNTCPEFLNFEAAALLAAASTSALSNTMNAAFPPNSIETFFTVFAHFSNINWNKESEEKFNYRVKLNETKFYIRHQFLDRPGAATKNTTIPMGPQAEIEPVHFDIYPYSITYAAITHYDIYCIQELVVRARQLGSACSWSVQCSSVG